MSDPKKFAAIKSRVRELIENQTAEVSGGKFIRVAGDFISEVWWLVKEVEGKNKKPAAKGADGSESLADVPQELVEV